MKFSLVLGLFLVILATTSAQKKVVCYWGSWSSGLPSSKIDANICTHVVYSFVGVTTDGRITNVDLGPVNDESLRLFAELKSKNPQVKLMVAAGGYNFGTAIFKELANSVSARLKLAKNVVAFLKNYNFDGFDVDWEYPANDKDNFVSLLTDLKNELSANNLILSVAVAAGKWMSDQAYDIPRVQAQVDFINLMTYDLHASWERVTGHNAPLFDDVLSVQSCVDYWILNGAPREKIILGIATYGQLFTLVDSNNNGYGAPTAGGGTNTYSQICKNNWNRSWIESKKVPYKYQGNQWVGYDDTQSVAIKARYSKDQNLGGVMIWSLENDDYSGSCEEGTFPLTRTVFDITIGKTVTTKTPVVTTKTPVVTTKSPVVTTKTPVVTTKTAVVTTKTPVVTTKTPVVTTRKPVAPPVVTAPTVNQPFQCPTANGLFADPASCFKYYNCGNGFAYSMNCNDGLKWNSSGQYCDFPQNVQC